MRRKLLYEALELLAMDADAQLSFLRRNNVQVDELALQYDDIAAASGTMLSNGELTSVERAAVDELSAQFDTMENSALWTESALVSSSEWTKIRLLARECLALLLA